MNSVIISLPETDSTNEYAINLLKNERPEEGYVVLTDFQTNGKGIENNSWESERDKNLTFSLVLYPAFAADKQFVFNKAISLGIYDFLKAELPESDVSIKWPNDIYIGNKKVCGILIQNSVIGNKLDYVVIGIGLNVNQTHFKSDAPNPVSLKNTTGKDYDLREILNRLLLYIVDRYSQVTAGAFQKIEKDYQTALYRFMEWHEFTIKGDKTNARLTGTSEYGQLILETEAGQKITCDLKDVKFSIS